MEPDHNLLDRSVEYLQWLVSDSWVIEDRYLILALVIGAVLAAAFVKRSPVSELLGHINTFVHEASHALVAALLGRSVTAIKLNLDQSGVTHTFGPRGPGTALVTLAGYPGPAVLAAVLSVTLYLDRPGIGLLVMILMFIGSVLAMRNLWGIAVAAVIVAAFAAVVYSRLDWVTMVFVATWVWMLAFGAIRPVTGLRRMVKQGRSQGSDADAMQITTGVPAIIWTWYMMTITIACSAVAVTLTASSLLSTLGQ